jgi:flagellar hook-basal body complex protein FliE
MKPVSVNTFETPQIEPGQRAPRIEQPAAAPEESFGEALKVAVGKVDALQTQADAESSKLASGEGNLHETVLALEKADVAMRLAVKVRSKLVDAYNEVMRMSV